MLYILILLIGIFIGMVIVALISVDKINESESLSRASRKSLKKSEDKVEELNQENKYLYEENKDLRFENEEFRELIKEFEEMSKAQQYGSTINMQNKIKSILMTVKSI